MENHQLIKMVEAEIADAQMSRSGGNEGRARVCARRAAGLAISTYYEKCLDQSPPASAYVLLQWYSEQEEISKDLREAARRLTVRVTPEYELPHDEDPIEDAKSLVQHILPVEL
jgi:hypothetical protein